jgi:signal transduction histidine kinase
MFTTAISGRKSQALFLGCLLAVGNATSEAQSPVKQVLVLQSLNRGNLQLDQFTGELRVRLDKLAGKPVNVVQVVVSPTGSVGAPEQAVLDYIRALYARRAPPDLIMTVGGNAAAFARQHRELLFPGTPLLYASVDQRWLRGAPFDDNETAVAVVNDFPGLVDDILTVRPGTRHVFVVIGSGANAQFWRQELETAFQRFRNRVTFDWSDELSFAEILQRAASLPGHSAIIYFSLVSDAHGGTYPDERVLADLHASTNVPLFGGLSSYLGHGIVGGTMMSVDDLARRTAEIASRILDGELPSRLRVPAQLPGPPQFDWRELKRWGIPESRLPSGSVVKYRSPTLWAEHKFTVLTSAGALVFQMLLITLLLLERRGRQRAEVQSRRNLELAANANRRAMISALTTSIGHELGQPISAIAHNAHALQMLADMGQADTAAIGDILSDIQSEAVLASRIIDRHRKMLRSHQLLKTPIDLHTVIDESLALLSNDMRVKQIRASLDLSSTPCVVDGDPVLLQQVFINLLRNAMDALVDAPPARRRILIRSVVRTTTVEVTVRDTGVGLPAEIMGSLFMPFVTTKSEGLGIGLAITQRLVEAHAGTITAQGRRGGGATFTITLPRSTMAQSVPETWIEDVHHTPASVTSVTTGA